MLLDVPLPISVQALEAFNGTTESGSEYVLTDEDGDGIYDKIVINALKEEKLLKTIAEQNENLSIENIKTAEIKDGITTVSKQTFSGCSGLTSVSIPDGVETIYVTLSGILIFVKDPHCSNALDPIRSTLSGMLTSVKDLHTKNALVSILVTPSGSLIFVKA